MFFKFNCFQTNDLWCSWTKDFWLFTEQTFWFKDDCPRESPEMVLLVFRDEPLLKEWYSWTFSKKQFHIQIFHRIAKLSSRDFPDHGGDHIMGCVRRCLKVVVPCRFRVLLTFLVNWRTGSVCKGFSLSFMILGNKFSFVLPSLSRKIVGFFWIFFFLMRRASPLLFQ